MKLILYRLLARLSLAVLRWEERGLLLRNAANRQYIRDVDEYCDGGLSMHDGLVEDYLEARELLSAGELALENLRIKIELLEIELDQAGKSA